MILESDLIDIASDPAELLERAEEEARLRRAVESLHEHHQSLIESNKIPEYVIDRLRLLLGEKEHNVPQPIEVSSPPSVDRPFLATMSNDELCHYVCRVFPKITTMEELSAQDSHLATLLIERDLVEDLFRTPVIKQRKVNENPKRMPTTRRVYAAMDDEALQHFIDSSYNNSTATDIARTNGALYEEILRRNGSVTIAKPVSQRIHLYRDMNDAALLATVKDKYPNINTRGQLWQTDTALVTELQSRDLLKQALPGSYHLIRVRNNEEEVASPNEEAKAEWPDWL